MASTSGSANPACCRRPPGPRPAGPPAARAGGGGSRRGRGSAWGRCSGAAGGSGGWSGGRWPARSARSSSACRRSQNWSGAVSGSRSRASSTPCSSYRWRKSAPGLSMTSWSASADMATPCSNVCSSIAAASIPVPPTTLIVLTTNLLGTRVAPMLDVAVIEDPAAAEVSLDPVRARLLAELAEPASATMLASRVGLPRQKGNYHLRALERHGLVELVEERRKGNCTERVLRATAASYVISPAALAAVQPDPERAPDRVSAAWLLAVASRLVRDVGDLITGAARAGQRVATFAVDGEGRFASAADRAAFAEELAGAVAGLVARYHRPAAAGGRGPPPGVAPQPGVHGL